MSRDALRVVGRLALVAGVLVVCSRDVLAARQSCHVDSRSAAVLKLEMSHQGTIWSPPHGCAVITGRRVCVPLVTIDGRRVPGIEVLAGDVAEVTSPGARYRDMTSSGAIHAGVATAVFNALVRQAAWHDRRVHATTAMARALARHELALYRSSPPPCGMVIPRGETPRRYFLSSRTIEAYREGMMVGQERDLILRRYRALPERLAFRRWLAAQLPRHTIRINGKRPTFPIAAAYQTR